MTTEGVFELFEIVPGVVVPADRYDHAEAQLRFLADRPAPRETRDAARPEPQPDPPRFGLRTAVAERGMVLRLNERDDTSAVV